MKKDIYSKVFLWMFIGLMVTFATAYYTSTNVDALQVLFKKNMYIMFGIIEIALAIFLSVRIQKMQATTARVCFLLYTLL